MKNQNPTPAPATSPNRLLVVLPFYEKDGWLTAKFLQWAQILEPTAPFDCLLAYDREVSPGTLAKVALEAGRYFASVNHFRYDPPASRSWPQGNNHAFQRTCWHIYQKHKRPFLWLESDTCPIHAGWVRQIADEYDRGGKPMMGNIVAGMGHMNGVGVYPGNMVELCPDTMLVSNTPWDIVMKNKTIAKTHPANHVIMHVWELDKAGNPLNSSPAGGRGLLPTFPDCQSAAKVLDLNAALYHRCKDGTVIDRLEEMRSQSLLPKPAKKKEAK